jgi:hypothetical protein
LYYEVTGQQPWGGHGVITISVETAKAALGIARRWAEQGVRNIAITTPKGESLDLDRFGMTVSTQEPRSDAGNRARQRL